MRRLTPFLIVLLLLGAAMLPTRTRAESWCAEPLWVHEWGVQVFSGGRARRMGPNGVRLPRYFHNQPSRTSQAAGPPVRGMPADSGMRAIPVLHFYSPGSWQPVPVAIEVGMARGDAAVWYPQVDVRRAAPAREQLQWDHLVLSAQPRHRLATSDQPWVDQLRAFPEALWVNGARESERFVFYEGNTSETPALRIERGPSWAAGRRHLILRNVGQSPVHDVFLVHREGAATFLFRAPSIPAGATAGLILEQHRTTPATFAAGSRTALRQALVDSREPRMPQGTHWASSGDCVMMRDPAVPVRAAAGHRLYQTEADALIDLWGPRFFDAPGTTVVYREDTRYLDRMMPLAIYTDMYHDVQLRRAGLAVIEGATLP